MTPRPVTDLTRALVFAADAHANQRRKGAAQEPYINHLIEVLDLVTRTTDGADMDMMIAALLHDVIEDTETTLDQLGSTFGDTVARIVAENSDDMVRAQGGAQGPTHCRDGAKIARGTDREDRRCHFQSARGGGVGPGGMGAGPQTWLS